MGAARAAQASRFMLADSYVEINEHFHEQGWSDGLPIMPPTEEAVAAMVGDRDPGEVMGVMPPVDGTVTVEKVAANAVMAGCRPEYFPVVLAGVRAMLREEYNLGSVSTTTGGAAPVFIVSGAYGEEIGINSGTGCFGSGFRPNATIF